MKIYLSNYRDHWISPYTIMEKVLFWKKWVDPDFDLYADKNDYLTAWLVPFCRGIHNVLDFVHPPIRYVKIDKYDTWSMDSTLSLIILPMLKQLRTDNHGAGMVDEADVPAEITGTFEKWNWVMDELIWAFEQLDPNCEWERNYHISEFDSEGYKKHHDRITNGLRLFGKYYRSLWD